MKMAQTMAYYAQKIDTTIEKMVQEDTKFANLTSQVYI